MTVEDPLNHLRLVAIPLNFEYLGTTLNNQNKIDEEISRRIMKGNKAYFANVKLIKSKLISRQTKMKIYKTLIRPVLTYGAETWTLTSINSNRLRVFERKVIRRIYGPILEGDVWRIRTNNEINNILQNEDIVRHIKAQRLQWLGHLERMDGIRAPRKMYKARMECRRRKGRPRSRWTDELEADLLSMNVRPWKVVAADRNKWKSVVGEAKVHIGL